LTLLVFLINFKHSNRSCYLLTYLLTYLLACLLIFT